MPGFEDEVRPVWPKVLVYKDKSCERSGCKMSGYYYDNSKDVGISLELNPNKALFRNDL